MEFHAEDYVNFLKRINPGIIDDYKDQMIKCMNLSLKIICLVAISNEADNPVFDGMYDFCAMYCGASIGKFCSLWFILLLSSSNTYS